MQSRNSNELQAWVDREEAIREANKPAPQGEQVGCSVCGSESPYHCQGLCEDCYLDRESDRYLYESERTAELDQHAVHGVSRDQF